MDTPVVKVSDIMQTSLHTIDGLASVQDAISEMDRLEVSSLVIERRHPGDEHGIVAIFDIASTVIAANRSIARTSVYQVMTKPALTVAADMNIKYAIRMLSRIGIKLALVMQDDELIGLVTLRDMVIGYAGKVEPKG
jgi:predicted transcriptional regulator